MYNIKKTGMLNDDSEVMLLGLFEAFPAIFLKTKLKMQHVQPKVVATPLK